MLEETLNRQGAFSVTHFSWMIGSDLHCRDMICSIETW